MHNRYYILESSSALSPNFSCLYAVFQETLHPSICNNQAILFLNSIRELGEKLVVRVNMSPKVWVAIL
jgi:hypothetical protein